MAEELIKALDAILNSPALTAPTGKTSDLIDPPGQRLTALIVPSIALFVSTLAVAARTYTRIFIIRSVDHADYFLLIAWGLLIVLSAILYQVAIFGPGIHQWDMTVRDLRSFLYWYHTASIVYALVICFIKLSILSQYITIFMPTRKPWSLYWLTIMVMVANSVSYLILCFLELFPCNPIQKAWDPLVTGGHCINMLSLNTGATGINTGSDLIILAIPQLVIWRLNMSWKNKAAVSVVFTVAILAIACSAIRLYYCIVLQSTQDVSYYMWISGIWVVPEIMFGMLVASLTAFRPLLRNISETKIYLAITSSFKNSTTHSNSSTLRGESNSGYMLDEQPNTWPPTRDSSQAWAKASRTAVDTDASSSQGFFVNTTIEMSVEDAGRKV